MIVNDLDVVGIGAVPSKAYPPLIIDSNAVLSLPITSELLCSLVLTGVVVWRQVDSPTKPAVTKVARRPEVELVGRPIGLAAAAVSIVVFADFQCSYCAQANNVVKKTLGQYPSEVKVMFRHLPIETIHPHAWTAALAAECAGAQGIFPEYHDLLYSLQDSLGKISWTELAVRAGVSSSSEFDKCLVAKHYSGEIERDVLLAKDLNVFRTPTFIIGDEAYSGVPPFSWIKRQIRRTKRAGG